MFDIFDTIAPGYTDSEKKQPTEVIKYGPNEEPKEIPVKKTRSRKKTDEPVPEEKISENSQEEVTLPTYSDDNNFDEQKQPEENEDNLEDNENEESEDVSEKDVNAELSFLENPETGHVLVGRKPNVFKKYGEDAALYVGKVNESGYPEKEIYFDSLDPQVVFVCGSRGSGKCLAGDTEIITPEGKLIKLSDLKKSTNILGLTPEFKIESTKKQGFYERTVNKILEIKLNTGKKIKLTPEHPLFTINGWKEAKDLKKGTRIATPRIINTFGKHNLPEHEAKLLAYFIAEGHLSNGFALFSNTDEIIIDDFKESIKSFDSNLRIELHSKPGCYRVAQIKRTVDLKDINRNKLGQFKKDSEVHAQKSSIIKYFENLGLYKKLAKEKFIPENIFTSSKETISLFLNRLFSCDGSVYFSTCWQISYSSSSLKLIEQVQHLLLRFGIISKLRTKHINYNGQKVISYELVIYGKFVIDFINKIGFFGKKFEKSKKCLKETKDIINNPNLDTIPKEIFNIVKITEWAKLGRLIGYKSPKSIINSKKYNISREKLLKIGNALKNKFLIDLANSDIYWDEIIEIKEIKEKTKVYDISVPKLHNFIANNIIVHNSYVLGVVAEELAIKNKNVGQIVIDPVGVFWSMKHPNKEDREIAELQKFGLEPQGLDNVVVFVPEGAAEKIPRETYDSTFTIQPAFLTSEDWALTFGIDRFAPSGLLLEKVIKKVRDGYRSMNGLIFRPKGDTFDLNDIILCMENDAELNSKEKGYRKESIRALVSRFEAAKTWGLFSKKGTPLIELSVPGQLTVIDTSFLDENVSALLVGILARRILTARKMSSRKEASKKINNELPQVDLENDIPPTWLFLDEAHTLIPSGSLATPASKAIVEYVKQGRKPGCSLVIATQQPSAIDTRVLSQVGTLITYKLIFDDDIKAVFKRMPTIVPKRFKDPGFIKKLGIGIPLFADRVETTSRAFVMTVRPRMSQHEGREIQTAETAQNLTQEEVLQLMIMIAKNKIRQFEELDAISVRTLLKILNMKYKTDIDFDTYHDALINAEVIFEKDKYFMIKEAESEHYEEKVNYNIIEPQYDSEEIEGFVKRATGWQNYTTKLVYRPVFKVNYKIYNDDGSYVDNTCYIDSVKVEFVHFLEKDFAYSAGLSILRTLEADDIRILMNLPKKQGFDMDYLKDNFAFGDVKLKNTMDRFSTLGLLRRERRSTKNVFFLIKNLEVPVNPLHKVLSTLDDLPVIQEPVKKEEILEARATFETVRNVLGTLWETIKIDDIVTLLKQEYLATNLDTKETAIFDTYTGKKIN